MMRKTTISFLFLAMILLTSQETSIALNKNPDLSKNNSYLPASGQGNISVQTEKNSLPSGVTREWLDNITDENGNRINLNTDKKNPGDDPEESGDSFQRKIFQGTTVGGQFGYSVSSAGDVNGDGFDDVIIGAPEIAKGNAYIFFGSQNMNTVADVTLTGENNGDFFGYSVSGAGDMNGDGYDDVVIGASFYNSGQGRAYVYFGGQNMNSIADVLLTGQIDEYFGYDVSGAGDFNGDGYPDIIIGTYPDIPEIGKAYLFLGGVSVNNTADLMFEGEAASDRFGYSLTGAGDLNGDGYGDIVIGADKYNTNTGRAYVYFGSAVLNSDADLVLNGEAIVNNFGFALSNAGDVNGDGYSDLLVGAPGYSSLQGRAYLFFGGANMNNTADLLLTGEISAFSQFGYSVSTTGDINGDGYSDIVIGAPKYSSNAGKIYVYLGAANMSSTEYTSMTGSETNGEFGYSVSSAGDVNGDGYNEFLAGAFKENSVNGRVYLFDNFMKGELISDMTFTGSNAGEAQGVSVASAGDVNGDGHSDIIVGAQFHNGFRGKALIYFGGPGMDNVADVTMTGETTFSLFGHSVSSAGDFNGDGYDDVIVGAFQYSGTTGRTYIFYGGSSMDNIPDVVRTGESNSNFGNSVSSAGDLNGDGFDDIVVGADKTSLQTGKAFVWFGGLTISTNPDVTLLGENFLDLFGKSVSNAGDLNGDGYDDIIVGSPGWGLNHEGRAYIFLGSANFNQTVDMTIEGIDSADNFGWSVSGAGDVNGDGYSDVIIGADQISTSKGKAYVFLGGEEMNTQPDVIMTGEQNFSQFGFSVSSAGDVNSDGYSDVIVGSSQYSNGKGRSYVFLGGLNMDGISDIKMTGEKDSSYFGYSVASVGDVDGDGYDDMMSGAFGYSEGSSNLIGRAYLFNGSRINTKPNLISVRDVPNDQGGKVLLKWAKSLRETYGWGNITDYYVYRSSPPGANGFQWEFIEDVPAVNTPFYYYTANTNYDSSGTSSGSTYFLIKAVNSSTGEIWASNILYGASIDNFPPPVVSPFTATLQGNSVRLDWGRSDAPDLLNYILYRSTSPVIDPDTEPVFATSTDLTLLDTNPLTGLYYYFIVAQDIHNNKSPIAVAEAPNMTLNLTMFIQGFYNASSNSQVSDTVTVELRNAVSPYAVADQSSAVVSASGNAVFKFGNAANGNYFIAVKHRNSIETWSSNALTFSRTAPLNYDMSSSLSQAFGNNLNQVDTSPLRFAIFSGDVDQNGFVDLTDVVNISNDANIFLTGYVVTDVNGDGITDLTDVTITLNNSNIFVSVAKP